MAAGKTKIVITHLFDADNVTLSESWVHTSKYLDTDVRMAQPFSNWITTQGWNSITSLDEVIYPSLVTEFYQNLHYRSDEEDTLRSFVDNIEIEVSKTSISEAMGVDNLGVIISEDGSAEGFQDTDWAKPEVAVRELIATWLTQEQCWAQYITTNVFLPKSGGVNCVSNREREFLCTI